MDDPLNSDDEYEMRERMASTTSEDGLLPGGSTKLRRRSCAHRVFGTRSFERTAFAVVSFALLCVVVFRKNETIVRWRDRFQDYAKERVVPSHERVILKYKEPQSTFRANLREDLEYVTTFAYGGLTNQLLGMFKLVHVAQRLDREVILPDLHAEHNEGSEARYSEFFDLTFLSEKTGVSMAEWRDLKTLKNDSTTDTTREDLSCWGMAWPTRPLLPYDTHIYYWPYPTALRANYTVEASITFPGIEVLNAQDNTAFLNETALERFGPDATDVPEYPNTHLLCFQNLFYASSVKFVEGHLDRSVNIEELRADGPVWSKVGQWLRFNARVNSLVDETLDALVGDKSQVFLAVHLRQDDFVTMNRTTNKVDEIEQIYQDGLAALRSKLEASPVLEGIDVGELPVLVATDSNDTKLFAEFDRMGWTFIDHDKLKTVERYGGWYPSVLDSAIISRAIGLVGTKMSTFSFLAERRIETWNGGMGVIVGQEPRDSA
ncbi:hypothetical protein JCM10212_005081 [Sporobolomyces blumeae]